MKKFCTMELMQIMDLALPYDEKYTIIINLGGFQQKNDMALPLRKLGFQFMLDHFYVLIKKID